MERDALHPYQHAYQMGKSLDTALVKLTDSIQDVLTNKNNTPYKVVKKPLIERRVDCKTSSKFSQMFFTKTKVNKIISISTARVCPQRGVISPIM